MARTQGTTARVQRLTSLVAVVLVGVAVGFAFGRVFQGREATYQMLAAGVASAVLAWAFERRSLLLATVVSLATLVIAIGLLVFPETLWYGLPTLDTLSAMAEAAGAVGEEARARVSPAEPVAPLMFASVTAVWAAVFSCHALAIRAGSPLLALLPPLALIAFADSVLEEIVKPLYGAFFLVAGLAIAFADSIRRVQGWGPVWSGPGRRSRFLAVTGRGARRIGLATVAVAVAAPFLMPGFGSRAVIDISSSGDEPPINVSPLVNMSASLTNGEPRDVFIVESERGAYWRMTALEIFDGVSWEVDEEGAEPAVAGTQLGTGGGAGDMRTTFTAVNDLANFDWLPAPTPATAMTVNRDVTWNEQTSTITVADGLQNGDSYTVTSTFPELTATGLRTEVFGTPPQELIALPEETRNQLKEIADSWTIGATTVYDKAMAIQRRLTSGGGFMYDEFVSPREDASSLIEFLTVTKTGFCQQFATAMAALLRSLGIPARVAVGFTTGTELTEQPEGPGESGAPDAPSRYRVTTRQLHAWVEVRFPESGWVGFEPTPGRGNAMFAHLLPVGGVGGIEHCDIRRTRGICTGGPRPSTPTGTGSPPLVLPPPADGAGVTAGSGSTRLSTPLVVGGGVLLLLIVGLAAVPTVRWARRRRLLRRAAGEPRRLILTTYDVVLERAAELGLPRGMGETPAEYLAKVTASGRLENGHLDRLTEVTVRAAYAAAEPTTEDALDATGDASEVIEELRRTSAFRDRILGPFGRRLR